MHTLNLRSFLWFATGVALTVTSVATFGTWRADAAETEGEASFVPIAPCRLFDTRPGEIAGSNATPFKQAETRTQQVTGAVGNCNIPVGVGGFATSGVAMNVTVLNPTGTGDSFLTLFPADETTLPVVSNLNWSQGQGATPNKVDVKLSPDGKIKIYNNVGTVDVIGDIVGYYQRSTGLADLENSVNLAGLANGERFNQLNAEVDALEIRLAALESDTNGIPSGTTVTGFGAYDTAVIANDADHRISVDLPGLPPTALESGTVNFDDSNTALTTDEDESCDGTYANPTAPPGKACVYLHNAGGIDNLDASVIVGAGFKSFVIRWKANGSAGADMFLYYSWAYTAA